VLSLYRSLLYLYPRAFRYEYGDEMLAVLFEVEAERKKKGVLARIVSSVHEAGGLLGGALQEHVRVVTGSSRWPMFPQRRFAMRSEFRFPKATVTLMAIILVAVLLAIDKAKAIQASVPYVNPHVGPIQPHPFTILPQLLVVIIVACVGGVIGWAVFFALHLSGIQRLSEAHPSGGQRASSGLT
jgi:hypothetical protein